MASRAKFGILFDGDAKKPRPCGLVTAESGQIGVLRCREVVILVRVKFVSKFETSLMKARRGSCWWVWIKAHVREVASDSVWTSRCSDWPMSFSAAAAFGHVALKGLFLTFWPTKNFSMDSYFHRFYHFPDDRII